MPKVVFGEGKEVELTSEELVASVLRSKTMPSSMWINPAVRYIERFYQKSGYQYNPWYIVVTETEPAVRTIHYNPGFEQGVKNRSTLTTATLSFPYIINVFLVSAYGKSLVLDRAWPLTFYRTEPLTDLKDSLFICNMPNIRTDPERDAGGPGAIGWTCYIGAPASVIIYELKKDENEITSVNQFTRRLMDYWIQSGFNGSAMAVTAWLETAKREPRVATMGDWVKNSYKDPSFVMTANWLPHPMKWNLGQVIEQAKKAHQSSQSTISDGKLETALKTSGSGDTGKIL